MSNIKPEKSKLRDLKYITYRRLWLDTLLIASAGQMRGIVVDLGGKRLNKRGSFHPPEEQAKAWWYVNIDMSTVPNVIADVHLVPLRNESVDTLISTEVLEHIKEPAICVQEMYRLLRPGGLAIVSVPFMYPVHADPFDFYRFTESSLQHLFCKFSSVEITPMGGFAGILGMFLELGNSQYFREIKGSSLPARIARRIARPLSKYLFSLDLSQPLESGAVTRFTTGYFVVAKK